MSRPRLTVGTYGDITTRPLASGRHRARARYRDWDGQVEAPMFGILWILSVRIRDFLRRTMPTDILLDRIRTRRGLKWGVPAMLLAAPYFIAANGCLAVLADGGPGWLNLLVGLFVWNGLKFAIMGPVSLVLLARTRIREALADRDARRVESRIVV